MSTGDPDCTGDFIVTQDDFNSLLKNAERIPDLPEVGTIVHTENGDIQTLINGRTDSQSEGNSTRLSESGMPRIIPWPVAP